MRTRRILQNSSLLLLVLTLSCGGGGSDGGTEADRVGVAAACASTSECPEVTRPDGERVQLDCLTQFAGGYCGIPDCETAADCPSGATCVRHDDGNNYCFRECRTKGECNRNRPSNLEANCSANFSFSDPTDDQGQKACIPPSSGS